jgi:hypothetical protein
MKRTIFLLVVFLSCINVNAQQGKLPYMRLPWQEQRNEDAAAGKMKVVTQVAFNVNPLQG